MALELQLAAQPRGDADQLGQMENRQLEALLVWASSFDCHASRERWQSGHGVTIASAPASIDWRIGCTSSPSAVSSSPG